MTPRVATVLSARDWEADLVGAIRESAVARLVLRAYQPSELDDRRDEVDVVVAGAETSWVTAASIANWRRSGLKVIGVYPTGDSPARRILEKGGADEILAESVDSAVKVAAIRGVLALDAPGSDRNGVFVAVTGARGAPGVTEVALALAWNLADTGRVMALDGDLDAPSLAVRLGLQARPDLADAADICRVSGVFPLSSAHPRDDVRVVVGSHRPGDPPLRSALVEDVLDAALGQFDVVVGDLGLASGSADLIKRSDAAILVCKGDAVGLIRAARVAAEWAGPPPALVLNMADPHSGSVQAARRWMGLDPLVVVPIDRRIAAAARAAASPAKSLRRHLLELDVTT